LGLGETLPKVWDCFHPYTAPEAAGVEEQETCAEQRLSGRAPVFQIPVELLFKYLELPNYFQHC
jgi:hypothetical protein